MKIQKSELAQKLNKLKSIVPKRTTQPVLQGILVKGGCLMANNLELSVKARLTGIHMGAEEETFLIPLKAFDLIGNLPDGMVEIRPEDGSITIKAGQIRNRYQTMDPQAFPFGEDTGERVTDITVDGSRVLKAMKRVSYAIPAQSGNQVMTALCLKASGGILSFTGLDGHVAAWDRIGYEGEFSLLVPKQTVEKMLSLGIGGELSIRHTKSSAVFTAGDYEIHTRLIDGEYFQFQKLFGEMPMHTVIDRNGFLDAMMRANTCTEERSRAVLTLDHTEMKISIRDNVTDYEEKIAMQEEMEEQLMIAFNPFLLIETLKAFDSKNVRLQLAGAKNPMIVESEDSDFKAAVLPVAI